ncbi:helix-turn-helix domain-containing protein [Paenibacillus pinihumi]|uniref:helix-turn-helix domain-containing protein n=1 Tax=Paenibacillus pinihumi TaxID=669462 RepID=UPI003CCBCD58
MPDLLDERGWSQRDLAIKADVNEKTLSRFTRDYSKDMPLRIAIPVSDALGVHPRDLVLWADE